MTNQQQRATNSASSWWIAIVFFGPIVTLGVMKWMESADIRLHAVWRGILVLTFIGIIVASRRLAGAIVAGRIHRDRATSSVAQGLILLGLMLGGVALSGALFFGGCVLVFFS